jgi:hypothetical protein
VSSVAEKGEIQSEYSGLSLSARRCHTVLEAFNGLPGCENRRVETKIRPKTVELDRFTHKYWVFWL